MANLQRNVAGQKLYFVAVQAVNGTPKPGDAANITATISKDGATPVATDDVNPTEIASTGVYFFDATQAETDAAAVILLPTSSTSGVRIDPIILYTGSGDNIMTQMVAGKIVQTIATGVVQIFDTDGSTLLRTLTPVSDPTTITRNPT